MKSCNKTLPNEPSGLWRKFQEISAESIGDQLRCRRELYEVATYYAFNIGIIFNCSALIAMCHRRPGGAH